MATATKLTYEDLVEGDVSRHDLLGMIARRDVEVEAASRYLTLLESKNGKNGKNGGGVRMKVSEKGCITFRGLKGTNAQFGLHLRVETLDWLYANAEKVKAFVDEHASVIAARSAASKASRK
jgi:hypothetical protein